MANLGISKQDNGHFWFVVTGPATRQIPAWDCDCPNEEVLRSRLATLGFLQKDVDDIVARVRILGADETLTRSTPE